MTGTLNTVQLQHEMLSPQCDLDNDDTGSQLQIERERSGRSMGPDAGGKDDDEIVLAW